MFNPVLGGGSLAAGAISQAIGDIFKGQAEAQALAPKWQESAEGLEASRQARQVQMMKLPAELAHEEQALKLGEQTLKLGEHTLEQAPLHTQKLRSDINWEGIERGWKSNDRAMVDKARITAMDAAKKLIDDPATEPTLKNYLTSIQDNPDAVMAHLGKMAEMQNKFVVDSALKALDHKYAVQLAEVQARLKPLTIEELAAKGMTTEQALAFKTKQEITLKEEMNAIRSRFEAVKAEMWRAIAQKMEAQGRYYDWRTEGPYPGAGAGANKIPPEITLRHRAIQTEKAILQQRVRESNMAGKPDAKSATRLDELVKEEQGLLRRMNEIQGVTPVAPGPPSYMDLIGAGMKR